MNQQNQQRMTVHDAARRLGISEDAVRMRVKRGKLSARKDGGRLYVMLESEPTSEPTDRTAELVERLRDENAYLRGVIAVRDQELAQRAEEIRRRDAALEREQELAAIFAERLRQLEAPSGERESPQSATEQPGRVAPQPPLESSPSEATEPRESSVTVADEQQGRGPVPEARGPQEGAEQPWWRRLFGG